MTSQACIPIHKKLKDLCKHHVDGFSAVLVHEKNIFKGLHWTSVVVELKLNCFVCIEFNSARLVILDSMIIPFGYLALVIETVFCCR
ncbi:hypothetical protein ISN44_As06g036580 [Arabidopsis suecica]|uniref:Uncharacterized protein n=1 Tax=Arabidopsis suecica TaxID=45249 RepID=A0A8T2CJ24_ARASU|nr:hypothetical protein ISN44_As06g036580 [Arabidopsis suecica]KAG7599474.1 hypothetical protein ISN44_As06g036580 [Arabidopsis suecica]KAG7599475.1 hypothetical protein ISN44_As06g036580 [Arabidopsis suecica]